jgi:hypothetical protein
MSAPYVREGGRERETGIAINIVDVKTGKERWLEGNILKCENNSKCRY